MTHTLPAANANPVLAELTGWRRWWLPENVSAHGGQMDLLFNVIFVVCTIVALGVFFFLIKFCIQYRHRPDVKKAHFSHGNKRLELIWTIIPAVLLLGLSYWAAAAWDAYRYSPTTATDPGRAQILVVGQQFKWNVVYPGPDKKLGRYLIYPRTTDTKWPADADFGFTNVPGPAFLPPKEAQKFLNDYVQSTNPLGKDFSDPDGKDDDYKDALSRILYLPKGRPIDIHLSSRDVLHDLYLPEFRVKLDAVPGMRGHIYFTATKSSADYEKPTQREYTLDELAEVVKGQKKATHRFVVAPQDAPRLAATEFIPGKKVKRRQGAKIVEVDDPASPPRTEIRPIIKDGEDVSPAAVDRLRQPIVEKVAVDKLRESATAANAPEYRLVVAETGDEKVAAVAKNDAVVTVALLDALKAAGVDEVSAARRIAKVTAFKIKSWEIVCEELCGSGHTAMRGDVVVLEADEYARRFESAATAQPAK